MESLPLMELSSLVKDIHAKTREASQNTDLDMRGFLRIVINLQIIKIDIVNNPHLPPPPSPKKKQKKKNKRNLKQQRLMNASIRAQKVEEGKK